MKKIASILLSSIMALSLVACGGSDDNTGSTGGNDNQVAEDAVKVALVVTNFGDQSYFDTAGNGMTLLREKYGNKIDIKGIEMGTDSAGWEPAYRQACDDGYDIVVSGNFMYEPYMCTVAAEYPEVSFVNFDYDNAEINSLDNILSINYACHETGYLAGLVAGVKTESNIVGCIGGGEYDGIKQFLAGYMQGVNAVNPDAKVISSFIGDFQDTGKAKEIASNMHKQGADVIYHAAGGAGNGLFDCAAEENFWAIGVDSDQYAANSGKPELAAHILTSSLKRCDSGVLWGVSQVIEGTAEFGTQRTLGYKDDAVGLVINDNYKNNMTEEQQAKVAEFADKLKNGEITVENQLADNTTYDRWLEKVGF